MKTSTVNWWVEEQAALDRGFTIIAGIDEAGRGPLAGPVVAAAVILPFGKCPDGVRDSKQMTPEQRSTAFDLIRQTALAIGVGIADHETVDRLNILRATHHAMREAVAALPTAPDHALIDGRPVHPFPILQTALIKGDGRSASIAAASVIAKVTRDRLMDEMDQLHPGYGFALHKGYSTPEHFAALNNLGPCPIHRRSFAPVATLLGLAVDLGQTALTFDTSDRQEKGMAGEVVAAAHLRTLGWTILCERFRCREGEIDLVAKDQESIVFVEVKTLRGRASSPADSVTSRKRARVLAAAHAWLATQETELACRFDVAAVRIQADGNATVELLRDAFRPGE